MSRSNKTKNRGESEAQGSRSSGALRTEKDMHAAAEVLDLRRTHHGDDPAVAVLHELRAVRELLSRIERRLVGEAKALEKPNQQVAVLSDDSIVDQRSVPAPPDLYLRLARTGAFPSNKIGKRIVARWGDVQRAVLGGPGIRKTSAPRADDERGGDGLDNLRRQVGLIEKG